MFSTVYVQIIWFGVVYIIGANWQRTKLNGRTVLFYGWTKAKKNLSLISSYFSRWLKMMPTRQSPKKILNLIKGKISPCVMEELSEHPVNPNTIKGFFYQLALTYIKPFYYQPNLQAEEKKKIFINFEYRSHFSKFQRLNLVFIRSLFQFFGYLFISRCTVILLFLIACYIIGKVELQVFTFYMFIPFVFFVVPEHSIKAGFSGSRINSQSQAHRNNHARAKVYFNYTVIHIALSQCSGFFV